MPTATCSAGDLIVPDRQPGIITPGQRRLTVRDLLTPGRTNSNAVQYVKETGFTNAAATVSETAGATKPQTDIKFDVVTSSVTTIAHWVLATRIRPASGKSWPELGPDSLIQVTLSAGFAENDPELAIARAAILVKTASLFENREGAACLAFDTLVGQLKCRWI